MPTLIVNNCKLAFEAPQRFVDAFDSRTSYPVPGYFFSDAYKNGFWDGREHLMTKVRGKPGWYQAPVGMLDEVYKVARVEGVEFTDVHDLRRAPTSRIETTWNEEYVVRPYQNDAIEAVLADRGLATGKGLLNIATRGGKTVIAARIIHRLGHRALFLVNSEMLLRQTIKLFEKVLGVRVGKIGAGVWDPADITVASLQTLIRHVGKTDECAELLGGVDVAFFDEAHHTQGEKFREVLEACDAFYKIGLSATIYFPKKKEVPKGTIWIRGACGPILYKITPSELIEQGWLVAPLVNLVRVEGPVVESEDYPTIRRNGIIAHNERNAAIARKAVQRHEEGLQVCVTARELDHVETLRKLMTDRGLRVGVIVGETRSTDREKLVQKFVEKKLDVLLGTVFGEAVDIPAIESVIVAEGGESDIASAQRFRNLTPAPGKERAVLDDFMDLHHRTLAKHSQARLALYRSHTGFDVQVDEEVVS
jgi:superfamily II DNA or RNA helicase